MRLPHVLCAVKCAVQKLWHAKHICVPFLKLSNSLFFAAEDDTRKSKSVNLLHIFIEFSLSCLAALSQTKFAAVGNERK